MCSCVDWIEQVVIYMNNEITIDDGLSYDSIKIFHFIMDVDLLCKNVCELWRCFNEESPFIHTRDVFHASFLGKELTDYEYLEKIRSFFGAHASNGNKNQTLINQKQIKDVRFFSSYSTKMFNEISVFIYSNYDDAEKLVEHQMKINIFDLIRYVSHQYNSITQLQNEISKQIIANN